MDAAFLGRVQPTEIPEMPGASQIDGNMPETVHPKYLQIPTPI
jgi:hypothetical protein